MIKLQHADLRRPPWSPRPVSPATRDVSRKTLCYKQMGTGNMHHALHTCKVMGARVCEHNDMQQMCGEGLNAYSRANHGWYGNHGVACRPVGHVAAVPRSSSTSVSGTGTGAGIATRSKPGSAGGAPVANIACFRWQPALCTHPTVLSAASGDAAKAMELAERALAIQEAAFMWRWPPRSAPGSSVAAAAAAAAASSTPPPVPAWLLLLAKPNCILRGVSATSRPLCSGW